MNNFNLPYLFPAFLQPHLHHWWFNLQHLLASAAQTENAQLPFPSADGDYRRQHMHSPSFPHLPIHPPRAVIMWGHGFFFLSLKQRLCFPALGRRERERLRISALTLFWHLCKCCFPSGRTCFQRCCRTRHWLDSAQLSARSPLQFHLLSGASNPPPLHSPVSINKQIVYTAAWIANCSTPWGCDWCAQRFQFRH